MTNKKNNKTPSQNDEMHVMTKDEDIDYENAQLAEHSVRTNNDGAEHVDMLETDNAINNEVISIGALLSAKREEMSLSITDVANSLNLSNSNIRALEEDRFKDLPNVLFCQGYLRNYASLLGLDANALIEELNKQLNVKSMRPLQVQEVKKIKPVRVDTDDRIKKMALYTIAPLLCLLIGYKIFIHSPATESDTVIDSATQELYDISEKMSDNVQVDDFTSLLASSDSDTVNQGISSNMLVEQTSPSVSASTDVNQNGALISLDSNQIDDALNLNDPVTSTSAQINSAANTPARSTTISVLASPTLLASESIGAEKVGTNAQQNAPTGTKLANLVIQYVEDAWTEIYDANDKRLVYSNKTAGERVELNAQAPFYMKLGRPTAAIIYLNGNIVSIKTDRVNSPISFVLE